MAIKINFTTKMGVGGEYVNFDPPSFLTKTTVQLKMNFWKDAATRQVEGAVPFNDQLAGSSNDRINGFKCLYKFECDLTSADNPYKQAYAYLKTLPEFAGAIDA